MKEFDVVIYGAAGATGRNVVRHLVERQAGLAFSWAIAGRDEGRLRTVDLGSTSAGLEVASLTDGPALRALCSKARVVVNLAGPYEGRAERLIEACIANGSHYLDLCGENGLIGDLIARYHDRAREARVVVVPACGFESLPFDLGVALIHRELRGVDGAHCERVDACLSYDVDAGAWSDLRGSVGFADTSARLFAHDARVDLRDPFSFVPDGPVEGTGRARARIDLSAHRHEGRWYAPLAPNPFLNPTVIQRSRALERELEPDGSVPGLEYREAIELPEIARSTVLTGLLAKSLASMLQRMAAVSAGRLTWTDRVVRWLLLRSLRASARRSDRAGSDRLRYRVELRGRSSTQREAVVVLRAEGDPGFRSTGRLIGEAALAVAQDPPTSPHAFGVVTPAVALGLSFLERLPAAHVALSIGAAPAVSEAA